MDLVKFAFFTIIISPLLVIQQQARAAPVCKDDSQCSDYHASYCQVYAHIKKQCPVTCNQCGAIHPSSPVTSTTASNFIDATQSTAVVSQSLTVTQSTVRSTSQVTSVPQSLAPTQSTVRSTSQATSLSQSLVPTQSTVRSMSQATSGSQSLTPTTQSTASTPPVLTHTQSVLFKSPPTQNTDVLHSISAGLNTHKFTVRASASKIKLSQANVLITLGILWSFFMYWY